MRKWRTGSLFQFVILGLLLSRPTTAFASPAVPTHPQRPKLLVVLVIDQLRYDYLERFRARFAEGGFNLLLNTGANFVNCQYDNACTVTAVGHASIFTGAYSNVHGIVNNGWYDRATRQTVTSVGDSTTSLVGGTSGKGASPHRLLSSTIGDELRKATDSESKVISISLKDRAAVLPGGHAANGAYWANSIPGQFVTSTYYQPTLPAWVAGFNQRAAAATYCGKQWEDLPQAPGDPGKIFNLFQASANAPCPNPRFLEWLHNTPYMNKIELDFALAAIQGERLGQDTATDLLSISLSVNDFIGHAYGPNSREIEDNILRTDRYLAEFFAELDRQIGLANVWIALTSDHGVAPNAQYAQEHNLSQRKAQPSAVWKAVQESLSKTFGADQWVEHSAEAFCYLNPEALTRHHVKSATAQAVAVRAAKSVPGVYAAFTREKLLAGSRTTTPLARKVGHCFQPQRGGDILVVYNPYEGPYPSDTGTPHGSPCDYDTHVPLILWGSAFKSATYSMPCQPIDLAPTLSEALGIPRPSGNQGHPLRRALK